MTTGPNLAQSTAARQGHVIAVFPRADRAARFIARLAEGGFWVTDVTRNRRNGRMVTFEATEEAFSCNRLADSPDRVQGITGYWLDMCETVGRYGSSPGEYPDHRGALTATLNGRPCPPEY